MMTDKQSAEKTVRDIRRHTRRKYSAEKKSVLYWKACAVKTALPSCAAMKALTRMCTTAGPRNSWRLARSAWQAPLLNN